MSVVIKVNNLSKRYRLGLKEKRADTFMGQMANLIKSPLDNFRQLRSLSKFKDDDESVFWALRDINFEVKQGEVLGIIGHNGAGKSTLLKILSRITEPTSGEVHLKGRVSALLEVGTGFHPELTGRENIFMNGTILGMTRREINTKLDEIVDFSGVEKHIDTPVKFYSSGMKVRLGFAVAAHLEPEILIIDEVLAVGDAEFQKKCLGKMEDVATQGRTVLFVSHDMNSVSTLCPTSILLRKGQIDLNGDSKSVISEYLKNPTNNDNKLIQIKDYLIEELLINNQSQCDNVIVQFNKSIEIVIKISKSSGNIYHPIIKFNFRDYNGQILFIVSNLYSNHNFVALTKNSVILKCTIPLNPLLLGEYYIDIEFRNEFRKEFEINNAAKLLVVEGKDNLLNNIKLIKKGVLVHCKWELI